MNRTALIYIGWDYVNCGAYYKGTMAGIYSEGNVSLPFGAYIGVRQLYVSSPKDEKEM